MMVKLWNWLVVADEHITCSSALFSISFTLNILLSSIPPARKNLFCFVRSMVHNSVNKTVNADTLANIDDNRQDLAWVGRLYSWLISPFYNKKSSFGKWVDALVTFVMVCCAIASVVLVAVENKSRLGLLFCIPFPLFLFLCTLVLFAWLVAIKILAFMIRKRCSPKNEPQRKRASEVFAEIADMAGVNNLGPNTGSSNDEQKTVGETTQAKN